MTLILGDPKKHCGLPVTVGTCGGGQWINGVLAGVRLTVGPVDPGTHPKAVFPVPECRTETDTLISWQNSQTGSLTCGVGAALVGEAK